VPDGGIAAYLLGLLASPLGTACTLEVLDVQVPRFFRRHRRWRWVLSLWFAAGLGARLLRRRPDLVHVHTSDYSGFWEKSLLARIAGARRSPVLMHLHGGSFDRFLDSLSGSAAQRATRSLSHAARVIVLAEAWRPIVARFAASERIEVLPNAVDWQQFGSIPRPAGNPTPRVLFLGMVSARKGLDDLLAAILELRAVGAPSFAVDIVGDEEFPGEWRRYRDRFHTAGLDDVVRFPGAAYGEQKLAYLAQADLFVLPSRNESFGIANLEAMAAGLPVVSTRTGAIPEYLQHGVHGLLVEPGDVSGLSRALGTLIADGELRLRLGEAARRAARAYDWEPIAAQVAALYKRVLTTPAT
jgi:glycosyltransferase involved in cell wall biosynthesis